MPLFDRFKNLFRGQASVQQRRLLPSVIEYDIDPHEYWEVLGELGDGAFGKVEKVCSKSDRSQLAAAKHIEIEDGENFEDFLIEIEILTQCTHENIVGLLACYFFDNKLSMMLEFCAGGAVDGIMLELEKPLTEQQIAYITRNVCVALGFLHANLVIHRDLKAGNILLTADAHVKLADFGVSAKMKDRSEQRDSFIGTPYWMAPEVMVCETFKDQPYGCLADIWSLGITLIEMAQMDPPNYQVSPMRVVIKVQKSEPPTLDRPSRWSIFFNDFIAKCLVKNPNDRYSAADLLTHPFVKNATDKKPVIQLLCEKNADILKEEIVVDEESSTGGSVADSEDRCFEFDNQQQRTHKQVSMDAQSDDVIMVEDREDRRNDSAAIQLVTNESNLTGDSQRFEAGGLEILPSHGLSKKKTAAPKPPCTLAANANIMVENDAKPFRNIEKYFGQSDEDVEILRSIDLDNTELTSQDAHVHQARETSSSSPPFTRSETTLKNPEEPLEIVTNHSHQRSGSGNVLSPSGQEAIDILDDLYNILDDDQAKTRSSKRITPSLKPSQSYEEVNDDWVVTAESSNKDNSMDSTLTSITAVGGIFNGEDDKLTSLERTFVISDASSPIDEIRPPTMSPTEVNVSERVASENRTHAEHARSARFQSSSRRDPSSTSSPSAMSGKSVVHTESLSPSVGPVTLQVNADDDSVPSLSDESLTTAQPGYIFTSDGFKQMRDGDDAILKSNIIHPKSKVTEIVEKLDDCGKFASHTANDSPSQERRAIHGSQPAIAHDDIIHQSTSHRPLSMPSVEHQSSLSTRTSSEKQPGYAKHNQFTNRYARMDSDASLNQQKNSINYVLHPDSYLCYSADNAAPPPEPPVDYDDTEDRYHTSHSTPNESKAPQQSQPSRLHKNMLGNSLDSQTTRSCAALNAQAAMTHGGSQSVISAGQEMAQVHLQQKQQYSAVEKLPRPTQSTTTAATHMTRKSPQRATVTKKTRTYVVDGVEVTSTTLHVLGVKQGHELRKKEMHDLKRMQREEARQQQELSSRAEQMREHQERKFAFEKQAIHKNFENDIEVLAKSQKKKIEELERQQEEELRNLVKKIRVEQERDLRLFKDRLKQEQKILKQEVDLLPKSQRKEMFRMRKEYLDKSHYEREADFLVQLDRSHDIYLCRKRERHREIMAETEHECLKQKHALERSLESALWELEERQLSEKHNLIAQQFKDVFHLQRTHMLARHQKELEHIKKINQTNEEELLRALTTDRKGLPKALRNESKTRTIMFKESLRIDQPNQGMDKWTEKIHEFEEKEKLRIRMKLEEYDIKCKRRLAQLVAHNQNMVKELEEIHNEKRNMLVDNERSKLAEYEEEYQQVIQEWKAGLSARKTALETKFAEELRTQERFYSIEANIGSLTAPSSSADSGGSNGGI